MNQTINTVSSAPRPSGSGHLTKRTAADRSLVLSVAKDRGSDDKPYIPYPTTITPSTSIAAFFGNAATVIDVRAG